MAMLYTISQLSKSFIYLETHFAVYLPSNKLQTYA